MMDLFARVRADKARLEAFCAAHDGERLVFARKRMSKHDFILVSRCPSEPGKWRATRFDAQGPIGHSTRATWREAVEVAVQDGADNRAMRISLTRILASNTH